MVGEVETVDEVAIEVVFTETEVVAVREIAVVVAKTVVVLVTGGSEVVLVDGVGSGVEDVEVAGGSVEEFVP